MPRKLTILRKKAHSVLGFMDWVSALRDNDAIRKNFEDILKDRDHPHHPAMMKLMLAYSEGTPIKRVAAVVLTPQQQETGQQVSERVWEQVARLAAVNPNDRQMRMLAAIQGAEAKLNAAVPAEVVE